MKKNKVLLTILIVILFIAGGSTAYVMDYYKAEDFVYESLSENSLSALKNEYGIDVFTKDKNIVIKPKIPKAGIIFYPGAKVVHEAYYPLLLELGKKGYLCVDISMPGRMAILDIDAAKGIRDEYPEIKHWFIAGHSMGGACAAMYADKYSDELDGLILLAAYSSKDLSDNNIEVISIYGSNDEVINAENYNKYKENVPLLTEYEIEGGCHAFFGAYGAQKGDGEPTIMREEQTELTVEYMDENIRRICR